MKNISIAIFAYSFNHRKTKDFVKILKSEGFVNISVIAAPKINLKTGVRELSSDNEIEEICKIYNYRYIEIAHSNINAISEFLDETDSTDIAIVSGARIIKPEIINLFSQGIINFHPGAIPETSGLDSFYWMIENNSEPGTTAHFIDEKVDAGFFISFHRVMVEKSDSEKILKEKIYHSQLNSLREVLYKLKSDKKICRYSIHRPKKNNPLSSDEKVAIMKKFPLWKERFCRS